MTERHGVVIRCGTDECHRTFGEAVAGAVWNVHPDRERKSHEDFPRAIRKNMTYRLPVDDRGHLFKCGNCGAEYELEALPTGPVGSDFYLTRPASRRVV